MRVRRLGPADLAAVLALQATAVAEVPADQFAPLTEAELARALGDGGAVHGAFAGPRLVAYQSLLAHGDGPDNLGHDLGLDAAGRRALLNLEETVIHPDARGQRLNVRLTARARAWARANAFTRLATTVSPFNVASLKSHMRGGFDLGVLVRKYGDAWRYVLVREL